jgi:hypothetical protein
MASPNTLTDLVPTLYNALDVVSRELVGFIPAVSMDATFERAAVGQTVRSFVAPASAAVDITPGATAPDAGGQTIGNTQMTISKARAVEIMWSGEEQLSISTPGITAERILQDQFAQAMRTLCNEVEADLAALYVNASRAAGTAGQNPFSDGSNFETDKLADTLKILLDNGAPTGDLQMIIDTAAGAGMRKVPNLYKANEAGESQLLRQGVLGQLYGFDIRESAKVKAHTKGDATGRLVNNAAGYAAGATSIAFDTGSGAFVAGDIVTFESHADAYVAKATATTPLVINGPGLVAAIADNNTITVGNNYRANLAFARSAIYLAARAPALPGAGDMADDRTLVTDPRSGLTFEVSMYRQYRQVKYEVALAWGVKAVKPEHIAILRG